TFYDDSYIFIAVEFQPKHNAKSRSQRRRQQSCTRGSANKCERLHIHGMCARRGPLADQNVQLVILQSGVQDFFKGRLKAMHFIDEQDLLVTKVRENGG